MTDEVIWTAVKKVGSRGLGSEIQHRLTVDHRYGPTKSIAWGYTSCGRSGKAEPGRGPRCKVCLKAGE